MSTPANPPPTESPTATETTPSPEPAANGGKRSIENRVIQVYLASASKAVFGEE